LGRRRELRKAPDEEAGTRRARKYSASGEKAALEGHWRKKGVKKGNSSKRVEEKRRESNARKTGRKGKYNETGVPLRKGLAEAKDKLLHQKGCEKGRDSNSMQHPVAQTRKKRRVENRSTH